MTTQTIDAFEVNSANIDAALQNKKTALGRFTFSHIAAEIIETTKYNDGRVEFAIRYDNGREWDFNLHCNIRLSPGHKVSLIFANEKDKSGTLIGIVNLTTGRFCVPEGSLRLLFGHNAGSKLVRGGENMCLVLQGFLINPIVGLITLPISIPMFLFAVFLMSIGGMLNHKVNKRKKALKNHVTKLVTDIYPDISNDVTKKKKSGSKWKLALLLLGGLVALNLLF